MTTEYAEEVDRYMALAYEIRVYRDECDGSLCYMAVHSELPGCMAQGDTPDDAVANLAEARRDYISALLEEGLEVPRPKARDESPLNVSVQYWPMERAGVSLITSRELYLVAV